MNLLHPFSLSFPFLLLLDGRGISKLYKVPRPPPPRCLPASPLSFLLHRRDQAMKRACQLQPSKIKSMKLRNKLSSLRSPPHPTPLLCTKPILFLPACLPISFPLMFNILSLRVELISRFHSLSTRFSLNEELSLQVIATRKERKL